MESLIFVLIVSGLIYYMSKVQHELEQYPESRQNEEVVIHEK